MHAPRSPLALLLVAALAAPGAAWADGSHGGQGAHEMTAEEHAAMGHGQEHADHGAPAPGPAGHSGHDAAPAPEDGSGHDAHGAEAAAASDRPRAVVLAGFAGVNAAIILAAAIARRRPASVKRRATLARVRAAAGGPR